MTRVAVLRARNLAPSKQRACRDLPGDGNPLVVERVGIDGSSMTFADGPALHACDAIPRPFPDPDLATAHGSCGGSVGRLQSGILRDPRLSLCTADDHTVTAFAWMTPSTRTAWVAVKSHGSEQIFQTAGGLPVRVTTSDDVNPEGWATFEIEEYGRQGEQLRRYELHTAVAG